MKTISNFDDDDVPVMIGRVHRRVQYFEGNRSEAPPASGFGSENDQHQNEEDMDIVEVLSAELGRVDVDRFQHKFVQFEICCNLCKT